MHGLILLFGNQPTADAGLIGDDEDSPARRFQLSQRIRRAGIDTDLGGIVAVVHLFHQGAVAIEENSAVHIVVRSA